MKELKLEREMIFYKANKQYIKYLIAKIKLHRLKRRNKWKQ
jgi:hypothetical protein